MPCVDQKGPSRVRRLQRNRWVGLSVKLIGFYVLSVIVLVVVTFLMLHLIGGDPVRSSLGPNAPPEVVAARRAALHLDEPLPQQFVRYVSGLLSFDLGRSIISRQPVAQIMAPRIAATARLAGVSLFFTVIISLIAGVLVGILTHCQRHLKTGLAFDGITGALAGIPEFLTGTVLAYFFGVKLRLLPVAGEGGPDSYILPAFALGIASAAVLARIVRIETLKVLGTDYMTTARSKRVPKWWLYVRHALPNIVTSSLALGGLILAGMLGGSILVETIFAWPGLGTLLVSAITSRDYTVVQGIVLVLGLFVLTIHTVVDLVIGVLDPRSQVSEL